MKNKSNERYIKLGITLGAAALFALGCYFVLANLNNLGGALRMVIRILAPFVYGGAIAYIVLPLCRKLEKVFTRRAKGKGKLGRSMAIVLSLLTAIIVVLAVVLLILPQLVKSLQQLIQMLPGQIRSLQASLDALLESHPDWAQWLEQLPGDWYAQTRRMLRSELPDFAQSLLSGLKGISLSTLAQSLLSGAAGVAGVLSNLMLGAIVAVYLLARRKQLADQARLLIRGALKPAWAQWLEQELRFADRMFNGFFMGKLLDSAIVGVICFVGCLVMGFNSPLLVAVIVGVTNIIPFFGPFLGAIPCALFLLLENPVHCLMFLVFVIILQQLDGNVIGPRILGNSTGLSGLWVMFAILLFGGLWGILGMIVGVPLMAVVYDVVRQLTFYGLRRHGQEAMIDQYNGKYHEK